MKDYMEFILIGIVILFLIIKFLWELSIDKRVSNLMREKESILTREYDKKRLELEKQKQQFQAEYDKKIGSIAQKELQLNYLISQKEELINQGVSSSISSGEKKIRTVFYQYPIFDEIKNYHKTDNPRLTSAMTDNISFESLPIVSADIRGKTGVYHVTLNSCTCPDFRMRHIYCKHMYYLALQLGFLVGNTDDSDLAVIHKYHECQDKIGVLYSRIEKSQQVIDELSKLETEHTQSLNELSLKRAKMNGEIKKLARQKELLESSIAVIKKDTMDSSWLAVQMADLEYLIDMKIADKMIKKTRPALAAAEEKRIAAKEKREWMAKAKALEYKLSFYESLDPSLSDVFDYTPEEVSEALVEELDDGQKFLPEDEYNQLTEAEKWQLALDKWRNRRRSNWQVGRDFERYIGYLYELDGYRVEYFGALEGKMDLGRDLIAKKKKEIIIIQCKRWADRKTIHEKHVFQLFGSVVGYEMEHPGTAPKGLLITTCPLSDVAIAYADRLSIEYKQNYPTNDLDSYPLIKCNIGRTGERIFHLPFDQQYDRVNIDQSKGEFYASTVQEAIDAGFRRAYRWRGQ